jgi:beta-N-acetylhexosaminidase
MLRKDLGFGGVVLADDLEMGATGFGFQRASVTIAALQAGNDMIMIRNRSNTNDDLPGSLAGWIEKALISGELTIADIKSSLNRIADLRAKLA